MSKSTESLIPASISLPELTFKSIILSIILTLILAAANAFLGLKVGATVSASIPAAVISLGILRFFKRHNVLESTMVQTAASAGEGLTAGLSFVVPAMLVLGFWSDFNYMETFIVGLIGGTLGVLYSIPIRRALINSPELRFPEGAAIGNVLKASATQDAADLGMLVKGGIIGAVITLFQTGFRVFSDSADFWWKVKGSLFGIGFGFSPALLAAGYIVGVNVGISMFVGVIVGWIAGVPILTYFYGLPNLDDPIAAAQSIWSDHIRYIGVGTMLVGGLWTLACLAKPVIQSLKTSWASLRSVRLGTESVLLPRTERDIPLTTVIWLLVLLAIPTFIFAYMLLNPHLIPVSSWIRWTVAALSVVYILVVGFAFSSISAYFAGLIGSTNSPGSGLTVSVLLLAALLLLAIFSIDIDFVGKVTKAELSSAGYAVFVAAIISAATVIANETIQDLKVGQIVGATPWKQQVMLMIGVAASAAIIPLVLSLLYHAYGMAGVFPHSGMDVKQMLPAPQAGLMAAVAKGAFTHQLPWAMIMVGGGVAVIAILIDEFLKPYNMRLPVLAVGLGIYLPFGASMPVLFGGLVQYLVYRRFNKVRQRSQRKQHLDKRINISKHRGLTLACGLVAGSSLVGVLLAIPFAIEKSSDAWSLVGPEFTPIANLLGGISTFLLCLWMFLKITWLGKAKR